MGARAVDEVVTVVANSNANSLTEVVLLAYNDNKNRTKHAAAAQLSAICFVARRRCPKVLANPSPVPDIQTEPSYLQEGIGAEAQ